MSKMASHGPFGHLQLKLWSKEGPGIKLAVWLPTTKSRESTRPQCVQMECNIPLKSSWGELQVYFRSRSNPRSEPRVMSSQSPRSKLGQFWDSSLGVPGIKAISMRIRWSNAENTIWGKVVASPKSGPWWIKWVRVAHGLSQHQECFQRWTNQLVVGFVVGCEWVNKFGPFPSPIPEPQHAPLPYLVLSAGSVPSSPQTSAFLKLRPPWA
jgi:hypothetical protein